jgi:hypothetical protein
MPVASKVGQVVNLRRIGNPPAAIRNANLPRLLQPARRRIGQHGCRYREQRGIGMSAGWASARVAAAITK